MDTLQNLSGILITRKPKDNLHALQVITEVINNLPQRFFFFTLTVYKYVESSEFNTLLFSFPIFFGTLTLTRNCVDMVKRAKTQGWLWGKIEIVALLTFFKLHLLCKYVTF